MSPVRDFAKSGRRKEGNSERVNFIEKMKALKTYQETLQLFGFSIGFADLRNILAHEYPDINFEKIKRFIAEAEPVYKELIDFVNKKIRIIK